MKKLFWIILVILLIGGLITVGYFLKKPHGEPAQTAVQDTPITTITRCFNYSQVATKEAPYSVTEQAVLTFHGETITGTKTGFQSGPDMTNGYEGTITGNRSGDIITAIFAYVVEGSSNAEQEEYEVTSDSLIKHRYPLIDQDGILVPDKTGTARDIVYKQVVCAE